MLHDFERCEEDMGCCNSYPGNQIEIHVGTAYAAWHRDINIRKLSTSGGVFTAVAEYILEKGGIVAGAKYDHEFLAEHVIVEDKEHLHLLRSTKYAQSKTEAIWPLVREYLKKGIPVLFTGTPCQISALYQQVGKNYENLYTMDVFCHGVIMPELWRTYLETRKRWEKSKIKKINVNYKEIFGWSQEKIIIQFDNGRAYCSDRNKDEFFQLFNRKYILCSMCYTCPYVNISRISDVSSGNYRRYQRNTEEEDNRDTGVSLLLVNSDKGTELLRAVQDRTVCYPRALEDAASDMLSPIESGYGLERSIHFWHDYHVWGMILAMRKILSENDECKRDMYQNHFFQKWMRLKDMGGSVAALLKEYGFSDIIIYGVGNVGIELYRELKEYGIVKAFVDKKSERAQIDGISVITPAQAAEYEEPIIITPVYFFQQIADELISNRVRPGRIISFNMLLSWKMEGEKSFPRSKSRWNPGRRLSDMFLITGAQFANKGAQSMLFVVIDEIRKRFKNPNIYYLPVNAEEDYSLELVAKYDFIFLRKRMEYGSMLYEVLPSLTAIIDVSGYGLSSNWNSEWYLNHISMARHYQVPIYLMPQSFGPFDFDEVTDIRARELLRYPRIIFAREKEGAELLKSKYQLTNIEESRDIVLQNKNLNLHNIYRKTVIPEYSVLETKRNVGIIPNVRNFEFGDEKCILDLYSAMIEQLLKINKQIYIFSHSDDLKACKKIYQNYRKNTNVYLIEKRFDCIEYSLFIKQFDFLIVSRFHAIVHAYKQAIPCIAIGWARKYYELLELFKQKQYIFDVRERFDFSEAINAIIWMNTNLEEEKRKIESYLANVQTHNCFECLDELHNVQPL